MMIMHNKVGTCLLRVHSHGTTCSGHEWAQGNLTFPRVFALSPEGSLFCPSIPCSPILSPWCLLWSRPGTMGLWEMKDEGDIGLDFKEQILDLVEETDIQITTKHCNTSYRKHTYEGFQEQGRRSKTFRGGMGGTPRSR